MLAATEEIVGIDEDEVPRPVPPRRGGGGGGRTFETLLGELDNTCVGFSVVSPVVGKDRCEDIDSGLRWLCLLEGGGAGAARFSEFDLDNTSLDPV